MLTREIQTEIASVAQNFWNEQVSTGSFRELATGKEIGHRIADHVDDKTTGLLATKFDTSYQRNKSGTKVPRSMGDIWLRQNEIYHPINVKTSFSETNGQPNMVSLKKLLNAILDHEIDAYYLLIVKFNTSEFGELQCRVYFVDLLDHLDCVTFDSGPGQIMMKSKKFFSKIISPALSQHSTESLSSKVERLFDLFLSGEKRLEANRIKSRQFLTEKVTRYTQSSTHSINPDNQKRFNL